MKNRIKKIAQLTLSSGSRQEEGVTLIELLAVIVILAIIAAVAVPVVLSSIHKSKVNSTEQTIATVASALNRYAADHDGTYATGTSLTSNADGGPYLQSIPNDAWDNQINVTVSTGGASFAIESNSTKDDITMVNGAQAPTDTSKP